MKDWKVFFKNHLKQLIALVLAIAVVISYSLSRSSDRTLRAGGFPGDDQIELDIDSGTGEEFPETGDTASAPVELVLDELEETGENAPEESPSEDAVDQTEVKDSGGEKLTVTEEAKSQAKAADSAEDPSGGDGSSHVSSSSKEDDTSLVISSSDEDGSSPEVSPSEEDDSSLIISSSEEEFSVSEEEASVSEEEASTQGESPAGSSDEISSSEEEFSVSEEEASVSEEEASTQGESPAGSSDEVSLSEENDPDSVAIDVSDKPEGSDSEDAPRSEEDSVADESSGGEKSSEIISSEEENSADAEEGSGTAEGSDANENFIEEKDSDDEEKTRETFFTTENEDPGQASAENSRKENGENAGEGHSGESSLEDAGEGISKTAEKDPASTGTTAASGQEQSFFTMEDEAPAGETTAAAAAEEDENRPRGVADTLIFEGPDYKVTASYGADAGIPAGASLAVFEITEDAKDYQAYCDQAQAAVAESLTDGSGNGQDKSGSEGDKETESAGEAASGTGEAKTDKMETGKDAAGQDGANAANGSDSAGKDDAKAESGKDAAGQDGAAAESGRASGDTEVTVSWVRLFDITIEVDGVAVEPQGPVAVQIDYGQAIEQTGEEEVSTVHFQGEEEVPVVLDTKTEGSDEALEQVTFETEGFSVFVVMGTTITKRILASDGVDYQVTLTCGADAAIPADAELEVREISEDSGIYQTCREKSGALFEADQQVAFARFFDITIVKDGKEIQPAAPVQVRIEVADKLQKDTKAVHFEQEAGKSTEKEADVQEAEAVLLETSLVEADRMDSAVTFSASGFSIYGIVYTVDFHYEANGKKYDFSIPGGGFISLEHLVEMLGVGGSDPNHDSDDKTDSDKEAETAETDSGKEAESAEKDSDKETESAKKEHDSSGSYDEAIKLNETEISEASRDFVSDVKSVEFSSPDLVWSGKVDKTASVGSLKENNKLEIEYSSQLTKKQIEEINAQTVEAGDWALISVRPFTSEEKLTVTMKNGDQWTVNVTDAQISTLFLSDSGELFEVTVTYEEEAQIPENAALKVTEFDESSKEFQDAWKAITGEEYFSDPETEEPEAEEPAEEASESEIRFSEAGKTTPAGMAALDITIQDPEGKEVEPKAPVSVSMVMKSLPENTDKEELSETAVVHHLTETSEGTVVETAASCNGSAGEITVLEDSVQAEFIIGSFSTYTITWGSVSNSTTNLRLRENNTNRAQIPVYYVDQDGSAISRPSGINANTDQTVSWSNSQYTYNITAGNLARTISGYTYQGAHSGSYNGAEISSVTVRRTSSGWYGYSYSTDVNAIYLVYSGSPSGLTVHYGYMDGDTFVEFTEAEDGDVPAGTTVPGPSQIGDQWDLEKMIPGYRYVTSRLNDPVNGREISSLLNTDPPYKANTNNTFENADLSAYPSYTSSTAPTSFVSNWRYRQLSSIDWNPTGSGWDYSSSERVTDTGVTKPVSFADSDQDLYVIYEKGSMQAGSGDGDSAGLGDLDAPATEKNVDPNNDGTYDVSLSVTGESRSQAEKTKANVVVILDTSWSMYEKDAGNGQSRLKVAKAAIGSLADKLFALNAEESDTIELAFITFAQRVRNEMEMKKIYSGSDAAAFKKMVNDLDCASGTNWDDALYAADHIYFNDNDPTYIVFVTDGDPISCAHPYGIYSDWDGGTYYTGRTNYEYALAAKNQADLIIANNKTLYTIGAFGEVSNLQAIGGTYLGQANDSATINSYFDGIIEDIRNVLGYEDVTIHDGITALTSTALVNGTTDQFRYTVTTKDGAKTDYENGAALQAAYPGIGLASYNSSDKTVEWNMGSSYMLEDGVTYAVSFTVWPSQEAYDYLADYNNGVKKITRQDAAVKKQFIVEAGGSLYQFVEGKGWTTDIPAKGSSSYISDSDLQTMIDFSLAAAHYLKTNTSASIDYTSVKTSNGEITEKKTVTGAEIRDPNGKMILDGTGLQMKKIWNDDLDKSQLLELLTNFLNADRTDTTYSVTLRLWQDKETENEKEVHTKDYENGFVYKPEVTISNGEVISSTWPVIGVSIAPGVMVKSTEEKEKLYHSAYPRVKYGSDTYIILETGHSYEITEDDIDLHFELDTDIYHPMVVNGTLQTVKFGIDEDGKRIITEISADSTGLSALTAANNLKGGLDIRKYVTTTEDASDIVTHDETFFTFRIKLQKSRTDTTPVYTTPDQFDENQKPISGSVGFRIFAAPVIPSDATDIAEDKSSYVFDGLNYAADTNADGEIVSYTARGTIPESGEITLKIRQSKSGGDEDNPLDRIRIVNLPAGTWYSVTEIDVPAGYESIKSEGISGTVQSNSQAAATYWNKRSSFSIDLLKVDELDASKALSGAEFSLFMEDGSTPAKDAEGNTIETIKTGSDGTARIGKLLPGTYKLVETAAPKGYLLMTSPVAIIVTSEKVTFQQGAKQPKDAAKNGDGLTWTITATNNAGYELPSTGGPGTGIMFLLGIMLTALAGAGLALRRRRKAA